MVTNYISGKTCIAGVYDRFPVNHGGWEVRAARWISQALRKMDSPVALEPKTIDATLAEFKTTIPTGTAHIRGISWNGYRIARLGVRINKDIEKDLPYLGDCLYWYDINVNGYITSNLEEGDIKIFVYKYIDDFDPETNCYYPRVPDNEEVLEAIEWYILKRMLERGHDIKGFSLRDNNSFTNPALAWETALKKARNSMNALDAEDRDEVSRMIRSFILDYNQYTQVDFNPNYHEA